MNVRNRLKFTLLETLIAVGCFSAVAIAQTPSPSPTPRLDGPTSIMTVGVETMRKGEFIFSGAYSRRQVRTEKHASSLMHREMPYRIILPAGYSEQQNSGVRYPVLYLLHGLTGHYENWTDRTKVDELDLTWDLIIVTPEGGDGWYTDSATVPNDKYESYIVKELIPHIDKEFRTIADREHRSIAGLSMGGYGSIKFGLKYPELFKIVGSFSGALDAPLRGQEHKNYRVSIMAVFGADDSPLRKQNDVFSIVSALPVDRLKALPYFYVSCGTEDLVNFKLNRDFADLLVEKRVRHEYRQFPGAHTWIVWDAEVQEFLEVLAGQMNTTKTQ